MLRGNMRPRVRLAAHAACRRNGRSSPSSLPRMILPLGLPAMLIKHALFGTFLVSKSPLVIFSLNMIFVVNG